MGNTEGLKQGIGEIDPEGHQSKVEEEFGGVENRRLDVSNEIGSVVDVRVPLGECSMFFQGIEQEMFERVMVSV